MEEPKISVIVPVYNVECYLCKCLDSIVNQSYRNLEIILVNDGSTDGSGLICDEYSIRDARLRVVHTENGGAFAARNRALDIATGDYIGFVDADDWIDTDMYQTLITLAREYDADVVQCEMINEGKHQQLRTKSLGQNVVYMRDQLTSAMFREEITHGLINKLFRYSCFDGFRFEDEYYHLDAVFLADIERYCNCFVRTDSRLYHYNTSNASITRGRKKLKHIKSLERLFDAYSIAAQGRDPEACFFICREIPSGGRLILPSSDIPVRVAVKHIHVMQDIFIRHWETAKKANGYRKASIAKKVLWFIYRHDAVLASLVIAFYTFLKQRIF